MKIQPTPAFDRAKIDIIITKKTNTISIEIVTKLARHTIKLVANAISDNNDYSKQLPFIIDIRF